MTLDERLERLTERHEALTQSVELLVLESRQINAESRQTNAENAAANKERDKRIGEIMEGVARLLHIAEIHEHRITRLEGGE